MLQQTRSSSPRGVVRILLLAAAAALLAAARALAQDGSAAAEELLRRSGTWEQLGSVESQVRAGFEQARPQARPSAAERSRIAAAIRSSFAAERLRATAVKVVADGLDLRHADDLRAWYASPTGIAITRREERDDPALQPDPQALAARGTAVLQRSSERRRGLLGDLARETRAAETAVDILLASLFAVQRGVAAATPDAPAPASGEIRAMLAAQRPRLLQMFSALTLAYFALTYETVSDAELERYVGFIASPAGQHFQALIVRAVGTAVESANEDFGRSLPGTRDKSNS